MKVCIFDIKRFAIHDGPGIRTTVFFKGCPLECWWCHNPEGIRGGTELFMEEVTLDGVSFEKEVEVGKWMDVGDLMDELERDRVYMEESGGGISISGGEPLQQPEALFRLLELSKERRIHTTVDTSGYANSDKIQKVSGLANLILFDLKTMNEEKHLKYTGVPGNNILENLERVHHGQADVIVRIPLVRGFNDTDEEMGLMLDFLKGMPGLEAIDLLPYHYYGTHKYKRFNRENRQNGFGTPTKQRIEEISKLFLDSGFRVRIGG
jgi:pyruvate formate lyase activating enzyme